MRRIALIAAAASVALSGPAAAAWETYTNEPLGYSVLFPGTPTEGTGVYKSDLAVEAKTHYATLKEENTTYIALEIDTGRVEDGAILMGEFEFWLDHIGEPVSVSTSRLSTGMEYGRFMALDCRSDIVSEAPKQTERAHQMFLDAAGLACPAGARLTVNVFFTQGRLYAIMGYRTGADAKTSSIPARFANSISWVGANAAHARTLVDPAHRLGNVLNNNLGPVPPPNAENAQAAPAGAAR